MADTIRTLDELNVLLRDNGQEELSAQDIRDLMISQMVHGEIGAIGNDEITLGSGWQTVDLDTAGVVHRGLTLNTTDHRIEDVPVAMKADVQVHVTFLGADGESYDFAVFKNGGPSQVVGAARTLVGNGARSVMGTWSVAVQLAADDTLQLGVRSSGNAFTLNNGLLRVRRIAVE